MPQPIWCDYLHANIEISENRFRHIESRHPDLLPEFRSQLEEAIRFPDEVRKNLRYQNTIMLSKYFVDVRGGKHIVAVVVSESEPNKRFWIVTAYITRKLLEGEILWKRN